MNRLSTVIPAILFVAAAIVAAQPAPGANRPHIVFLLADDLGWGDVGFHGSEIKTPCLDRLAASGARLEQFYVQPVCSPTRASLMTGRYPTLLKLAGAPLAQKLSLDGKDAWPAIAEGKRSPHDEILHNAAPKNGAIRIGDWKLVINGSRGTAEESPDARKDRNKAKKGRGADDRVERVELFNIAQDPYEKNDLAGQLPEKAEELRARYDVLARQAVPPKTGPQPPGFRPPKVWGQTE
jgi:arylsulfatase A-like enzyme